MIPQNFFLGGGAKETLIGVVGALLLLLSIILMLSLRRKYVIVPTLLAVFLIPQGEVIVLAGLHLPPVRIIALVGLLRAAWLCYSSSDSLFSGGLNFIDKAFLGCMITRALAFILLWKEAAAVTNQVGFLLGGLGSYVLLRFLIRDKEDVYRTIKVLAVIALLNMLGMVYEQLRVQNLFGLLIGGVDPVPLIREGRIRSQGAFGHAILAGTFGATLLPLFVILWRQGKAKAMAGAGMIASLVMVLTSASSTPLMAIFGVGVGVCLWPLRKSMRVIRWGVAIALISLHLVMKAPVWFLIARVDMVGGSASFDRAYLIDVFVKHFWDWWLVGTKDIGSWGWSMWDLSDTYVSQGESGGLLALIFFVAVIVGCFSRIGRARRRASGTSREWDMWLLGVALYANVMAFFGVSYWDQTEVVWFTLLAILCAATGAVLPQKVARKISEDQATTEDRIEVAAFPAEPAMVPALGN
jgi:hypothetical protein